ncbi:hypothetical protein MOSE0_L03400 [Monosporozyma servazzii]
MTTTGYNKIEMISKKPQIKYNPYISRNTLCKNSLCIIVVGDTFIARILPI